MILIPAIDLYQGKVVRLRRGNPKQSTVYSEKPIKVAENWVNQGAKLLHVVDLSAALGEGDNLEIIKEILSAVKIDIEVGGGIRDIEKAQLLLSLGAKRIIIGTKSLEKDFLKSLKQNIDQERLAISIDVSSGKVAIEGWQRKSAVAPLDFIKKLTEDKVEWIIYTDISRDGTLSGLNLKYLAKLSIFKEINFIISGGLANTTELKKLKEEFPFIWGVISGKALYEAKIKFKEAASLLEGK
jgi:phosphoribosylformimino-5-aminoimidazole carboxamide ribotide isomerase